MTRDKLPVRTNVLACQAGVHLLVVMVFVDTVGALLTLFTVHAALSVEAVFPVCTQLHCITNDLRHVKCRIEQIGFIMQIQLDVIPEIFILIEA